MTGCSVVFQSSICKGCRHACNKVHCLECFEKCRLTCCDLCCLFECFEQCLLTCCHLHSLSWFSEQCELVCSCLHGQCWIFMQLHALPPTSVAWSNWLFCDYSHRLASGPNLADPRHEKGKSSIAFASCKARCNLCMQYCEAMMATILNRIFLSRFLGGKFGKFGPYDSSHVMPTQSLLRVFTLMCLLAYELYLSCFSAQESYWTCCHGDL